MATSKPPAFQFYPQDYLASTRVAEMTLEEEGVYIRLLCYCWASGSIPADPERCARLAGKGCSVETATTVQRSFNEHPTDTTKLVHDRLDIERENQRLRREQASGAGKKSAAARLKRSKNNTRERAFNERSTSVQREVNTSSSSSSSSSELDIYLEPNSEVVIPQKMQTEKVREYFRTWIAHLTLEYPEKVPPENSPQLEMFWQEAARMGPDRFCDAVQYSTSNNWATLHERNDIAKISRVPSGKQNGGNRVNDDWIAVLSAIDRYPTRSPEDIAGRRELLGPERFEAMKRIGSGRIYESNDFERNQTLKPMFLSHLQEVRGNAVTTGT